MPWTREKKIYYVTAYLETKSGKTLIIIHRKAKSLDMQISNYRVSKKPQQEDGKSQIWQEVDSKMSR